jgi:hypothetical protein
MSEHFIVEQLKEDLMALERENGLLKVCNQNQKERITQLEAVLEDERRRLYRHGYKERSEEIARLLAKPKECT